MAWRKPLTPRTNSPRARRSRALVWSSWTDASLVMRLTSSSQPVVQDDRHGEVFFIRQVTFQKGLDDPAGAVQRSGLVAGLRLVERRQFDHTVGLPGKVIQHPVQISVILFQHVEPGGEPWIRRSKLREIAVVFPAMMPMQVSDQVAAMVG